MDVSKCPVMHGALTSNRTTGTSNQDWWPNQLNLSILRQHGAEFDPHKAITIIVKLSKSLILRH